MGESKHTPGPWKYGRYTQSIQAQDGERLIANLDMRAEEGDPSVHADGLVIAAAPLMLEALQERLGIDADLLRRGSMPSDERAARLAAADAKMRAAIKAATGGET